MSAADIVGPLDGQVREGVDNDGRHYEIANTELENGRALSMYRYDNGQISMWFFNADGEVEGRIDLEQNRMLRDSTISIVQGAVEREFRDHDLEERLRRFSDRAFSDGTLQNDTQEIAELEMDAERHFETAQPREEASIVTRSYSDILESHTAFVTVDRDGIDVDVLQTDRASSIFLSRDGQDLGAIHAFNDGAVVLTNARGEMTVDLESVLDEQTLAEVRGAFADGRVTNEEATTLAAIVQQNVDVGMSR